MDVPQELISLTIDYVLPHHTDEDHTPEDVQTIFHIFIEEYISKLKC